MSSSCDSPKKAAGSFISPENGNHSEEEALAGARDIIAEKINEHADTQDRVRRLFLRRARIKSGLKKGKESEGHKFKDYFD